MLMLAMIVDSQQIRSGRRQAGDIAFEAARAGAQALDPVDLHFGFVQGDSTTVSSTRRAQIFQG